MPACCALIYIGFREELDFFFLFFARAFVRFQPDSFSRIFSPLPRFFIHFFLFLFCRKISSGTRMLMHHANRVRWQHKNITPRFHSAYTSLHYRFQSRPRHDQPIVIGINPGQKSDVGPSDDSFENLYSTVFESTRSGNNLFIYLFVGIFLSSFFFSENFYTLYSLEACDRIHESGDLFCHYVFVVTVHRQRRVTN